MPSWLNSRSALAVICGALAYLALYGLFLILMNVAMKASAPTVSLTAIVISWMLATAVSGFVASRVMGKRSFFHGCVAGALGGLAMVVGLHWFLGPVSHMGFLSSFWVIASGALGGCGALIGRDHPSGPSSSTHI
jgi:hypothetical protein